MKKKPFKGPQAQANLPRPPRNKSSDSFSGKNKNAGQSSRPAKARDESERDSQSSSATTTRDRGGAKASTSRSGGSPEVRGKLQQAPAHKSPKSREQGDGRASSFNKNTPAPKQREAQGSGGYRKGPREDSARDAQGSGGYRKGPREETSRDEGKTSGAKKNFRAKSSGQGSSPAEYFGNKRNDRPAPASGQRDGFREGYPKTEQDDRPVVKHSRRSKKRLRDAAAGEGVKTEANKQPSKQNASTGEAAAPSKSRSARWEETIKKPPNGQWFITGSNGVSECLRSPAITISKLWVDPTKLTPELAQLLSPHQRIVEQAKEDTLYGRLSQGIGALVTPPEWPDPETLLDRLEKEKRVPLLLALDQVEDPMNLGQILRTCEGAGVDGVILLKHRSVHVTQTVAQISQGAFAWLPVMEVTNLRQTLDLFKSRGIWSVGCEAGEKSKPWNQFDYVQPTVLVFGAEGRGLRSLTSKTCDGLAALPMRGKINSLNVGAATAAFLYEVARQRSL